MRHEERTTLPEPEDDDTMEPQYLDDCQLQEEEQRQRELAEIERVQHFVAAFHAHAIEYDCLIEDQKAS